jgi:hypothetical protein
MYIYRLDEMATKDSNSSKYQSTTCSLLDLSSLAITTSVIVPTPYIQMRSKRSGNEGIYSQSVEPKQHRSQSVEVDCRTKKGDEPTQPPALWNGVVKG